MEDDLNFSLNYNDNLKKMEDDLKKNKNGRQPKKNGIRPKKKWKTTYKNKMEDLPINQNQPNWL